IHYEVFMGNYVAGLALVITLGLLWRTLKGWETVAARMVLVAVSLIAAGWGFVECHYTVRLLDDVNVVRDEALHVACRLVELAEGIKHGDDIVSLIALFGWGRHTDRLNSNYKPLTFGEVDEEARRYGEYVKAFDAAKPGATRLDYLIAPATEPEPFLANIDKW